MSDENNATSNEIQEEAPIVNEPQTALIEEGIVTKRGPFPLRLWQKRYLSFPSTHHSFSLYQLRFVYKKNVKKSQSNRAEFEKVNKDLFETIATATVNANCILAYYKLNAKDLPQGLIDLKNVKSVERAPKIKKNAFIIHCTNRDYIFSTQSNEETDLWVNSIQARLDGEVFSYNDTEAFKFSYDHLVNRKGFFPPTIAANNEEEVFSASEAEFVSDEIPANEASSNNADDNKESEAEPAAEEESSRPKSKAFSFIGLPAGILSVFNKDETKEEEAAPAEATEEVATEEAAPVEEAENSVEQGKAEEPAEEEKRPFLVRLLSGHRKSKIETPASPIEPEAPAESEPVAEAPAEDAVPAEEETKVEVVEERVPFLTRILSGRRKSKIEVVPEPEIAETEQEAAETTEEPTEAQVSEENKAEEQVATEEPESRPFLVRLLSGNRKSTIETPAKEETAEVEESNEAEATETAEPEAIEEPKEETKEEEPNFIRRILSGKRKSTIEVPTSPKAEEPAEIPAEEATEAPAEEAVEAPEGEVKAEEDEEDKRPFIVRVLSGNRKSFFGTPTSPKPQEEAPLPAEEGEQADNEAPVIDVEISENATESNTANTELEVQTEEANGASEGQANEAETEAPAQPTEETATPARQPSLISRIGGYAYSAVVPTLAATTEEEEELDEHYIELSKEALKSGYLSKQSYLLHSANHRYVILNKEGEFVYYRSGSVVSEGKKITFDKDSQVETVDELTFTLKSQGGTYTFVAKVADDAESWKQAIQGVIDGKKETAEQSQPEEKVLTEVVNDVVEEVAVVS